MTSNLIELESDGCYHPSSEEQICALVRRARDDGAQLRVLGSSHSVWRSIVTDRFAGPATPPSEMMVVLDRYTHVYDPQPDPAVPGGFTVEVQAGCHLGLSPVRPVQGRIEPGGPAASDVLRASPWHDGEWEASLNQQLHHKWKLALSDLGGITHQTVSGFLSTGSSGGSTKWSIQDAILAIRVVDASGTVSVLRRDDADPTRFRATGIAMGLAGVISTVTLRCEPAFDIVGSETISIARKSDDLDFYGDRLESGLPSLEKFLLETDYVRLMWWPQWEFDRLVVWQAKKQPFDPDMEVKPYREIASFPVLSQVGASVLLTVLGNIDQPERIFEELASVRGHSAALTVGRSVGEHLYTRLGAPPPDPDFPLEPQHLLPWLTALFQLLRKERHDPITLGAGFIGLIQLLVTGTDELVAFALKLPIIKQVFRALGKLLPEHVGTLLGIFVTTGKDGRPATQHFQDRWFLGLPMDNQMDDLLMPTWFTELWIPFTPGDGTVEKVITTLRTLFDGDGTAEGAFANTGFYSFELYAARADETFYLSASNGGRNVFRVDVFWFARSAGNPVVDFYPRFWEALAPFEPRYHWGKFLPTPTADDPAALTRQYPDFAKWNAVREAADPTGVFLTRYWREQLGLGTP